MIRRKIRPDTWIMWGALLLHVIFFLFMWKTEVSEEIKMLCCGFAVGSYMLFCLAWWIFRREFIRFSDSVCRQAEELINGRVPQAEQEEDTLESKVQMKLDKLSDVMYSTAASQKRQKQEIQQMVSDISHQLKTPIANITMYSAMLESPEFSPQQKKEFTEVIENQVKKLEFLVNALAKMSRLEGSLIHLEIKPARIFDTLFQALSQAGPKAEQKGIELQVDCDQELLVSHDSKWTQEALFNILDNAVKYTPEGGKISVTTEVWEMFTKIEIRDTGMGIAKEHLEDIFKRFYREGKVHLEEGLGIGLYLTRQIINQQGGYVKVNSVEGQGSSFQVFLPNQFEVQREQ